MLRKITCTGMLLLVAGWLLAQNPVSWSSTVKKLDAKTFEVRLTAKVAQGWHIYASQQPEKSISIPTDVSFKPNPLIVLEGPLAEIGTKLIYKNETLDIEDAHFEGQVDYIQKLSLKSPVKTNLSAVVRYQACTGERCLPPATYPINILIN